MSSFSGAATSSSNTSSSDGGSVKIMKPKVKVNLKLSQKKEVKKEVSPPVKRRKILGKRTLSQMKAADVVSDSIEGANFKVASSTGVGQYNVNIRFDEGGFKFSCNCGDQFGVATRTHCKHIGNVITSMMGTYVTLFISKGKATPKKDIVDMDVTSLSEIFDQMLTIIES
jgi:hypothetical protein